MPNKKIKEVYKIRALANSCYTRDFLFYSLKFKTAELLADTQITPTWATEINIASTLPYHTHQFLLFIGNLFCTPDLFQILREKGIGANGTARKNVVDGLFKNHIKTTTQAKSDVEHLSWGTLVAHIVPTILGQPSNQVWQQFGRILARSAS